MNGLPYYKAYPRDFIEGTIGMRFELKGAYRLVLDLIYMQGGKLPDDARYISGLLGCSMRAWKGLRAELVSLGKLTAENGVLTNYRAIIELETLTKLQDKQRENGGKPKVSRGLQKPRLNHTEPEPDIVLAKANPIARGKRAPGDRADVRAVLMEVLRPETADAWLDHRAGKKSPMTRYTARLMVEMIRGHPDPDACVEASIVNGWTGIFPEKGRENGTQLGQGRSAQSRLFAAAVAVGDRLATRGGGG